MDLLEITDGKNTEDCIRFVDDMTIIAEGTNLQEAFEKLAAIMTRKAGGQEWAMLYDCKFALDKFGLMGLTKWQEWDPMNAKKTRPITRPTIKLGNHIIKPTTTHKFLGIIIDQELCFKEHVNYALEKGNKFVGQYQRLTKPSRGATAKHMCQYYIAVAIPRMLYTTDIFLIPGSARNKGTKGHINELARIKRQATLAITGAMKTTANDTLDMHVNLLPFHLLVSKIVHRAATRLACLPDNHPLPKHILRHPRNM